MQPKEAIILAGGLGTRLKSVIEEIPKPMAQIGERPFLEYLLKHLQSFGIEHVILSVGYNWKIISDHFGTEFGPMEISYAVEKEPMGTGGGIRLAMEKVKNEHLFILNGDTFFQVNLRDLSEFYFAHEADMSMTVKRKRNFSRYGTVELDICKVIGFKEKKSVKSGLINGGVYITRKTIFDNFDLPTKFSFETDFLEKHLNSLKVCAMRSIDYFIDIGVPLDYEKASRELPAKEIL
jgi:D-glycero-alpha-D-manno-heptose 1-phosphate guanylyltransferase